MTFALAVGTTETASIDGISAAGANPTLFEHTPSADAELLVYGDTVYAPAVPISPDGCPTPALITRAVHELLALDPVVVDGGLAAPTAAPTVDVDATPGADIRAQTPVTDALTVFENAKRIGQAVEGPLVIGESIPGGTTTALGVLRVLGEPFGVSSSLPENPLTLKQRVVDDGLAASDLERGALADEPLDALSRMGDPVLTTVVGLIAGAAERDTAVTLAGGTQLLAAAALIRHAEIDHPLTLATTSFVDRDDSIDLNAACNALALDLVVTDPGFDLLDHHGLAHYAAGVGKEGAGMGGALALAREAGIEMSAVRERILACYDRVVETGSDSGGMDGH